MIVWMGYRVASNTLTSHWATMGRRSLHIGARLMVWARRQSIMHALVGYSSVVVLVWRVRVLKGLHRVGCIACSRRWIW